MSSVVWNYFKKIDKQNVSCNLCGKTYKSSGNTTNLSTHLKTKHYHAFMQLKNTNIGTKDSINITPRNSGRKRIRTSSPISSASSELLTTSDVTETETVFAELSVSGILDDDAGVSILFIYN